VNTIPYEVMTYHSFNLVTSFKGRKELHELKSHISSILKTNNIFKSFYYYMNICLLCLSFVLNQSWWPFSFSFFFFHFFGPHVEGSVLKYWNLILRPRFLSCRKFRTHYLLHVNWPLAIECLREHSHCAVIEVSKIMVKVKPLDSIANCDLQSVDKHLYRFNKWNSIDPL
jgi:hypothetical protein